MKTILAVLGVIVLVGILLIGGCAFFVYKKSQTVMTEMAEKEVQRYIANKNPPPATADTLRRFVNAGKLQKSYKGKIILSLGAGALQDQKLTAEELQMIDEAGTLLEQPEISNQAFSDFMQKHPQSVSYSTSTTRTFGRGQ